MDASNHRSDNAADVLAGMMKRAVAAVFGAYGLPLQEVPRTGPAVTSLIALAREAGLTPPAVGATISFNGPNLRGELLVASTLEITVKTRPAAERKSVAPSSAAGQIMIRDWIGELVNQILGHFKTQSTRTGLSFETGMPMPLSGHAMALATPKGPSNCMAAFRASGGSVFCWFDIQCAPGLDVRPASMIPNKEGELILL
jgi:hypothetical protein